MPTDERAHRLARAAANAADAWLNDPRDHEVYRRLVAATLEWRAYTQPTLEGLAEAGRRDVAAVDPSAGITTTAVEQVELPDAAQAEALAAAPGRQPTAVGDVLKGSGDPKALLAHLTGRPSGTGAAANVSD